MLEILVFTYISLPVVMPFRSIEAMTSIYYPTHDIAATWLSVSSVTTPESTRLSRSQAVTYPHRTLKCPTRSVLAAMDASNELTRLDSLREIAIFQQGRHFKTFTVVHSK